MVAKTGVGILWVGCGRRGGGGGGEREAAETWLVFEVGWHSLQMQMAANRLSRDVVVESAD